MALFPPGKGGGELVEYGYKGKGVTIHSLVDANLLLYRQALPMKMNDYR